MYNLLPKDTTFFDGFDKLSQHVLSGARLMLELTERFPTITGIIQRIRVEEHSADELAHEAFNHLDESFITPFEREDIHQLVRGLDDIMDDINALANRLLMYHVSHMEPLFRRQSQVLVEATTTLCEAVQRLPTARRLSELSPRLIEIHRLENVGDENHHLAISRLFEETPDSLEVVKWMDLFGRIQSAIHRCDDVGNTLRRIMVKSHYET